MKVGVAFYNVENLFDTEKGPNNDVDFLPDGANYWTKDKYEHKLSNLATVISQVAGNGPAVLGLAEVENRGVLEDLVAQEQLASLHYQIVHYDSPDFRGIDCALLFRPEVFQVLASGTKAVVIPGEEHIKTRDILYASGLIDGETFHFLVGHWPSRSGGEQISLNRRMAAAHTMRSLADSLQATKPGSHVVMMGDFNDDPTSPSVSKGLGVRKHPTGLRADQYFTPMLKLYEKGVGTLAYRDVWSLFDIIVVNGSLLGDKLDSFKLYTDPNSKMQAFVYNKAFMRQSEGKYKGYPLRSLVGNQYQGGYSDHFPVYIYLVKKVK